MDHLSASSAAVPKYYCAVIARNCRLAIDDSRQSRTRCVLGQNAFFSTGAGLESRANRGFVGFVDEGYSDWRIIAFAHRGE